jgi:hypothetical protein
VSADVKYCYDQCHHLEMFAKCIACH